MAKPYRKGYENLIKGKVEKAKIDKSFHAKPKYRLQYGPKFSQLLRQSVKKFKGVEVQCDENDLEEIAKPGNFGEFENKIESPQIIIQTFSEKVLKYIKSNPAVVRNLSGRDFENLIAEIIASLGFEDISLRVSTHLGEVDILCFSKDVLGSKIGYIFELKQRGESMKPVTLSEVTRLYGLKEGLNERLGISQGVFVTTTNYTSPSREAANIYSLTLKDYQDVLEWLNMYEPLPGGLYLEQDI